jgi:hypothetical protein
MNRVTMRYLAVAQAAAGVQEEVVDPPDAGPRSTLDVLPPFAGGQGT